MEEALTQTADFTSFSIGLPSSKIHLFSSLYNSVYIEFVAVSTDLIPSHSLLLMGKPALTTLIIVGDSRLKKYEKSKMIILLINHVQKYRNKV